MRFSSIDGDDASFVGGLKSAVAIIIQNGTNQVKAMVMDDLRALVTNFNLLSFGGNSWRRSL